MLAATYRAAPFPSSSYHHLHPPDSRGSVVAEGGLWTSSLY